MDTEWLPKVIAMVTKTASILLVASISAVYVSLAQPSYKVIEARKSETVASYVLSIPPSEFKKDALFRLASDFLQHNPNPKLLKVGIYTDRATALDSRGKNITHFAYAQWLHESEIRAQRKLAGAAELLRIGTPSTLRIRYSDGRLEEVPIAGQNVFHPTVNGVTLDLLYFTSESQGFPAKQLIPHLYFSVPQKVTLDEASALAQSLFNSYGFPGRDTYTTGPMVYL